jgi:hypothetical protein
LALWNAKWFYSLLQHQYLMHTWQIHHQQQQTPDAHWRPQQRAAQERSAMTPNQVELLFETLPRFTCRISCAALPTWTTLALVSVAAYQIKHLQQKPLTLPQ